MIFFFSPVFHLPGPHSESTMNANPPATLYYYIILYIVSLYVYNKQPNGPQCRCWGLRQGALSDNAPRGRVIKCGVSRWAKMPTKAKKSLRYIFFFLHPGVKNHFFFSSKYFCLYLRIHI